MSDTVPALRIRTLNRDPVRTERKMVLYWMTASRRLSFNFALDRAAEHARELGKPLLVLEPLRAGYPWACDRFHRFVLDGMAVNARAAGERDFGYHPYVEPGEGAGKGLLSALATHAAVVVTDDLPTFLYPRMLAAAANAVDVRLEAVDSAGLLPVRAVDRAYPTAYAFRRVLQQKLPGHLLHSPKPRPPARGSLASFRGVPAAVRRSWPAANAALLDGSRDLAALPIDHGVLPVELRGGTTAARRRLTRFLSEGLPAYARDRNRPGLPVTSGLSPYLHFGHLSVHEVFAKVVAAEGWTPDHLGSRALGKRAGWWGMSEGAEGFLDQLVTWRELGLNAALHLPRYTSYRSLPVWARETLDRHRHDPREPVYTLREFEAARTHDPLWNAAQRQLVTEGTIHNYLRMLWGKKILEWSATPEKALETLLHLNDKYALDGRDANSVSGIFWILGRYDRPWPERPVYGKIRSMSSASTARKVDVTGYLERFGPRG